MVFNVAHQADPELAKVIERESIVLSWLSSYAKDGSARPSGKEAMPIVRDMHRLLQSKHTSFAERLSADKEASKALMRFAFPAAMDCMAVLLVHVPSFSKAILDSSGTWKRILRIGSNRDAPPRARPQDKARRGPLLSSVTSWARTLTLSCQQTTSSHSWQVRLKTAGSMPLPSSACSVTPRRPSSTSSCHLTF